jgi:hypothetical protein
MKQFLLALAACFAASASLQAQPACLNGPVTQGTLTVSCAQLDPGEDDFNSSVPRVLLFQIKASSANPNVIGFRLLLSFITGVVANNLIPQQQTVVFIASYTISIPGATPSLTKVTGVSVQELVASSSGSF